MDSDFLKDIRCFYLMNGQVVFAEYFGLGDETNNPQVRNAVMVMIGQNKQIAMSTAYPFTNIDETFELNRDHVTVGTELRWNPQLMNEYDNFWQQLRAKAAGIIMPGSPQATAPIKPVQR